MKTPDSYSEDDAETDMVRGYRDVPDDDKLRALSYVRLCDMLESSTPGTTAFMVIEAEKRRRDASPTEGEKIVTNVGAQPAQKPAPDHWYKKPVPVIIIAIIGGLVLLCIRYILKNYVGLDL